MEWTILESDLTQQDPSGVEGFIQRMDQELRAGGPPLEGFKFLTSAQEMLRITREIENEASGGADGTVLYVGFQTSEKLHIETGRYHRLNLAGVRTVGFGQGEARGESAQLLEQWVDLPQDTRAFENQWYLVMGEPTPIVFIGWETSDREMFGQGGISTPGKEFKGFVSNDKRTIEGVIDHLERVRRQFGPDQPMLIEQLADEIPFPVRRIMVVTDDGRNSEMTELRLAGAHFAAKKSASVVLYDMSAASYLTSPYPSQEYERDWNRTIDQKELGMIGRQYLVSQLEDLKMQGISGGVVLPTGHGFSQLAERAERENVDLIIIPSHLAQPGPLGRERGNSLKNGTIAGTFFAVGRLMERIKGYTLKNLLDSTSIPVVVYAPGGMAWLRTRASQAPSQQMNPGSLTTGLKRALDPVVEPE